MKRAGSQQAGRKKIREMQSVRHNADGISRSWQAAALRLGATMPACNFHVTCPLVAVSRTVGEVLFEDALKTDF
jgi:hypothetical protein